MLLEWRKVNVNHKIAIVFEIIMIIFFFCAAAAALANFGSDDGYCKSKLNDLVRFQLFFQIQIFCVQRSFSFVYLRFMR
jgi:hypothetical protein